MKVLILLLLFLPNFSTIARAREIRVGSKAFTEGYLLGELAAQTIEAVPGASVSRKFGLGNTGLVFQALMTGEIDVYPEYTGTIAEALLHDVSLRDPEALGRRLRERGLVMSRELGFENTYALAVRRDFARANGLEAISDLKRIEARLRVAFSHEFMSREDGLRSLERVYGLKFGSSGKRLQAVEHSLSFQSIAEKKADLIDVYSTDDKIETLDLVLLRDDKGIFPPYKAVFLAKETFVRREPRAWEALNALGGSIDESTMRSLNGEVERTHQDVSSVIAGYRGRRVARPPGSPLWREIERRTQEHLALVGVALLVSIVFGIPLGILSSRSRSLGQIILLASAIVQTIPSLALLCLLIPLFGIGVVPALVALCLYSFLPVVLNTLIGLQSIDPLLLETARAIGLSPRRILLSIELPLASRTILGGLRTSAIIGIGTATLAALIGAGGYGAPIISGLATNDLAMILTGAIPCAVMALIAYALFELAARVLVPTGLRKSS